MYELAVCLFVFLRVHHSSIINHVGKQNMLIHLLFCPFHEIVQESNTALLYTACVYNVNSQFVGKLVFNFHSANFKDFAKTDSYCDICLLQEPVRIFLGIFLNGVIFDLSKHCIFGYLASLGLILGFAGFSVLLVCLCFVLNNFLTDGFCFTVA